MNNKYLKLRKLTSSTNQVASDLTTISVGVKVSKVFFLTAFEWGEGVEKKKLLEKVI